jgi:type II secretory pathway pseudopilin PulG
MRSRLGDQRGVTLLEVLIAAILLIIIFFGLAQYYTRGRTHLNYEEDRRKATAVAQDRIDGIRRDYSYDGLMSLNGTDTTYVVDQRDYIVKHEILPNTPEDQSTTLHLTIEWDVKVSGSVYKRTHEATTILGRGMP